MPSFTGCWYSKPKHFETRRFMMLEAVRQTAYDMVECGFVFDFEKPIDIKQAIRDCAEYHLNSNDNESMWVYAAHARGFDNLDLETLRLEFVRVYKRLIDLADLGAFNEPDQPVEPAYDPIEAMRSYGSMLNDAIRIHAEKGDVYGDPE